MREHVVNRVWQLRKDIGVTQEVLADALGSFQANVIAIEKGNYIPSLLLGLKIARFFKKPIEKIFSYIYENNFVGEIGISFALIGLLVFLLIP